MKIIVEVDVLTLTRVIISNVAVTLSYEQQNAAEVLVPQLLLKDLLSHGAGELHEAAMSVREWRNIHQAYTSTTVSSSLDVWAFGVIATKVFLGRNLDEHKRDAATLSFEQQNAAEVLLPQLLLKDLLSHSAGDLHEAAMFVKECLETKYRPSEIQKWKMMCHPNLLPLLALQCHFHQVGPVEECAVEASCWASMPIMDVDLRTILSDLEPLVVLMGTATPSEAAMMMAIAKHVLREILKGLQALHDLGLVHRDIKEHNILLSTQCSCRDVFTCACPRDRKCEVAIADFDSIVEEGAKHSSRRVPGTYGYRAPEAYTSATVSSSLDVWAFGVIATKVFLGRNLDEYKRDAATLSFEQQNAAEVLVPPLLLKDLLSHGAGDLHEAAMFVRECLEVDC